MTYTERIETFSSKLFWLAILFLFVALSSTLLLFGCSPLRHYELASYGPGDTSAGDVTHASDSGARVVTLKQKSMIISGCDETLWAHVYNPQRLLVHERCVSVTGTIVDATHDKRKDGVRKEKDGDCHGWLKPDAGQEKYINAGNISDEESNLVFEIVCMFKVTQKDAISACKNYKNKVKLPPVGSHVRMTGSFVQDDNHARWNELHPVSSIEVLPK